MNKEQPTHVDATNLNCPVPLMMLRNAMKELPSGAEVIIEVTDIHAELDFMTWCERFGHQLKLLSSTAESQSFLVTKSN